MIYFSHRQGNYRLDDLEFTVPRRRTQDQRPRFEQSVREVRLVQSSIQISSLMAQKTCVWSPLYWLVHNASPMNLVDPQFLEIEGHE